jgi:hypothetical protein
MLSATMHAGGVSELYPAKVAADERQLQMAAPKRFRLATQAGARCRPAVRGWAVSRFVSREGYVGRKGELHRRKSEPGANY